MTWESKLGWTDVIAIYAAVVATVVLVWDWWKWKHSGPSLRIEVKPGVWHEGVALGAEGGYHLDVKVTNIGDRPTTIEELQMTGRTWYGRELYNGRQRWMLPKVLDPGTVWETRVKQTERYEKASDQGRFYVGIKHSHAVNAQKVRVKVVPVEK